MKILAFNGSPRKTWNTATLLEQALAGAASQGAETELIHLYEVKFKGCISCFECKTPGGKSYGKCAVQDGLTPILAKVEEADALILGSPIYFATVTGEMRSFMERLLFPYLTYTDPRQTLFPKKIPTGFIYTMNVTEKIANDWGYPQHFDKNAQYLGMIFGSAETFCSFDTLQFQDYDQVLATCFDAAHKATRRQEVFPQDCQAAFDLGVRFTQSR